MIRLYLYRLKLATFNNEKQNTLLNASKPVLLEKLLLLRPGAVVRRGIEWTMADSEMISEHSIFFNFGRITKKQKDRFDREARSFYEMLDDDIDRVSCFYDANAQVLAIENRSGAPSPSTIANYISKVIESCKENEYISANITPDERSLLHLTRAQIDSITDPISFIEYIKQAFKIQSFEVFFSPENTYDYDEMLQAPMQRLMGATDGEKSSAGVSSSEGLRKDKIIELSHAAAAHGDDAKAKIYNDEDSIGETIKLKKKINSAYIEIMNDALEKKAAIFNLIKEKFKTIRG